MSPSIHDTHKRLLAPLRAALYDSDPKTLAAQLERVFDPAARIHLAYPFEDLDGPRELYRRVYRPLLDALPDLERRDFIVIAGSADTGDWVGCAGYYIGVFERPWLDIPATRQPVTLRFHEFFRVVDGRIVEMQALWDIPEVMLQARAWPLAPSLGVAIHVPGPATQDGLVSPPRDPQRAAASVILVREMLGGLARYSAGGHAAMRLADFWHPKMTWYGPAGIGTNRRIEGFRQRHQIPFLNAMPDREALLANGALFGDGNYVGFTAWPGMRATISNDGWLGIAPAGQVITLRSLDFWRCENDLIRENWVLVDILDVYRQIGVDVFARMRELTADRRAIRPAT